MKLKLTILSLVFSINFKCSIAQTKYPVAEELLPLLDKIPNLNITLEKANKKSSCGDACCTENVINDLLIAFNKIASERKNAPAYKENKKLNLSDINIADATQLDLKSGATALAKNSIKVLDSNPSMLSGKTIKVLDSNPAMLGNKSVKVLDTNPSMLSNKKSTKSLDTNPTMLANPNKSNTSTNYSEKKPAPSTSTNENTTELEKLLKDESNFREKINNDWDILYKEYNSELDKIITQKKNIENNNNLNAKTKEKQLKELRKTSTDFFDKFMLNKANPLLKQQKEETLNRYTYLEIIIKQSNYGIDDNSLYASINDAQDTILEIIEALGVYSSDCVSAGCQLNQQIN